MHPLTRTLAVLLLLATCLAGPAALAQSPSAAQAAAEKAWKDAREVAQAGPKDIRLAEQATLKLPAGRVYIPQPQATALLQAMGNPGQDPTLQGLVFPEGDAPWFMTVRFEPAGYIRDDDARDWNADDLLKSYREGTEASNEERLKIGAPALEILGWAAAPAYDSSRHRLVWAMKSREKGQTGEADLGVNHNTYLLGREGYVSLNLVTDLKDLPAHQPEGQALVDQLAFLEGKRYTDFDQKTDRVAEYGLAALVLGVGAKKLGLLAMLGVFLAKFAKIGLLALAGGGALVAKFFKRKQPEAPAPTDTPPPAA